MVGYGDPVPYEGISNEDEELLLLYVGTSFSMRSSGTVGPAGERRAPGDAPRLMSELFDRAEDDL